MLRVMSNDFHPIKIRVMPRKADSPKDWTGVVKGQPIENWRFYNTLERSSGFGRNPETWNFIVPPSSEAAAL